MNLTKKYRIFWNPKDKTILSDYRDPYGEQSVTHVGEGLDGFESDDLADIEAKIMELGLKWGGEVEE